MIKFEGNVVSAFSDVYRANMHLIGQTAVALRNFSQISPEEHKGIIEFMQGLSSQITEKMSGINGSCAERYVIGLIQRSITRANLGQMSLDPEITRIALKFFSYFATNGRRQQGSQDSFEKKNELSLSVADTIHQIIDANKSNKNKVIELENIIKRPDLTVRNVETVVQWSLGSGQFLEISGYIFKYYFHLLSDDLKERLRDWEDGQTPGIRNKITRHLTSTLDELGKSGFVSFNSRRELKGIFDDMASGNLGEFGERVLEELNQTCLTECCHHIMQSLEGLSAGLNQENVSQKNGEEELSDDELETRMAHMGLFRELAPSHKNFQEFDPSFSAQACAHSQQLDASCCRAPSALPSFQFSVEPFPDWGLPSCEDQKMEIQVIPLVIQESVLPTSDSH